MIRSVCLKMTLLVLLIHMALPAQAAIRSLSPVSDFLNPRDQQASWKFKLNKLTILASEESSGDEPYFMMIGFKVTNIADPATVQVFSNILQHVSKKSLMNNTQAVIPPSAGEISFGDVNEDMFGLLGVVVIAFESDATGWSTMERIQGDIKAAIRETLVGVTTDPLSVNINSLNLSKIQTAITKNVSSLLANSYAFDIDDPIGMTTHIYLKVPAVTTNILRQEVLDLVYRKEDFPTALPGVVNDLIFSDAVYQVDAQMMRTWTHPDVAPAELTAPEVNGRSLTLSWIDRTSNETHFEVYDLSRNVVVDRPPRYTGRTARVSAPEMSGILPNQTYRFQVKACKDNFCSPASNFLTVRTPNTLPG
ncbi:MAG: fibronectin type III domain-containing protein, partial [Candidatus Omnitrophica bacterium]|nr:fibronectin type III domain-containing protein [Candidatus Omnitrophota bacterium]